MSRPTYDVLVAEPDEAQGQIIDMLLASATFDVTVVTSGRSALAYLQSSTPDLCMLALDLADVNGDDICIKIRRVTRLATVPVVLIAPQAGRFGLSDDARRRARRAGADLVLPRPLGDKNLRSRVQALLDARDAKVARAAFSTNVIEEALAELDERQDGSTADADPSPEAPSEPPRGTSGGASRAADSDREEAPEDAQHDGSHLEQPKPPSPSEPADEHDGNQESAELANLRKESEILRVENAQLKRKLREKQETIDRGDNPKLEKRVAELERRNAALLERLQELEGDSEEGHSGGGFFGRRS